MIIRLQKSQKIASLQNVAAKVKHQHQRIQNQVIRIKYKKMKKKRKKNTVATIGA